MFKKIFLHGLNAGILCAIAAILYNRIYFFALGADFSKLVNIPGLIGISILSCLLAAIGYGLIRNWLGNKSEIVFNLTFTILSFASIVIPFAAKLPLDIQNPELFPGLTVPMHFFPAVAWFTLKPLFKD